MINYFPHIFIFLCIHSIIPYLLQVAFPSANLDLSIATGLRHLCLASTHVNNEQLEHVANNCRRLTSLNLHGCQKVLHSEVSN